MRQPQRLRRPGTDVPANLLLSDSPFDRLRANGCAVRGRAVRAEPVEARLPRWADSPFARLRASQPPQSGLHPTKAGYLTITHLSPIIHIKLYHGRQRPADSPRAGRTSPRRRSSSVLLLTSSHHFHGRRGLSEFPTGHAAADHPTGRREWLGRTNRPTGGRERSSSIAGQLLPLASQAIPAWLL